MADDVNHVILIGNLVRDLGSNERDFGYTQSGVAKGTVTIASNRSHKDSSGQYVDEVSYFDIIIWGKTAENLKPYLLKGKKIAVDGVLKQERWTDQQGNNKSRIVVNALSVQLLGGKEQQQNNQQNPFAQNQSAYAQQYQNQQNRAPRFEPAHNNGTHNDNYQQNGFVQEDLPYDNGNDYPQDIPF